MASNPLEEVGVIAAKATQVATMEAPATWSDDGTMASPARKRAPEPARAAETVIEKVPKSEDAAVPFRREVRVIGGRPGSHSAREQDGRALIVAAACGASIVAAAAILYYLFLA